jgi:hypothetical protein
MFGFGDYDRWKLDTPPEGEVCDKCGGYLRRAWPHGWCCDYCDDEAEALERELEARERQLEEQAP